MSAPVGSLSALGRQSRQHRVGGKHGQKAEKPLPEGLKGPERHSKHLGFLSVSHSEPGSHSEPDVLSLLGEVLGIEENGKKIK